MRPTFLGLSVQDFKTSVGWGANQTSTLSVALVQDPDNGDVPAPPPLGSPIYFQFFDLKFFGLLQKWAKKNSPQGLPIWEAVCVDPREILEGTQLIIGNYTGPIGSVRNLVNCYAWWEQNHGFGSSGANDSGMPWGKIQSALLTICDSPVYGLFGGPLTFRGYAYSLDLSELPAAPASYRLGGTSVGLLEAVSALCDDAGCDFHVVLEGFRIKVKTVSRRTQPPLGTIAAYTETNWGNVLRSEDGLEVRNETTSSFLVGGDVCTLHTAARTDAASFWGYDLVGRPILGVPGLMTFKDRDGKVLGTAECEFMGLNASGVEDILGALTYQCSTVEMRLAMVNYESWAAFVRAHRPDVARLITSPFANEGFRQALGPVKPDVIDDRKDNAAKMAAVNTDYWNRCQRLFEFVRSYGTDFYGKKFLVAVPQVLSKLDPETLRVTYSQEPAEGGWLPEGSAPLGLPPFYQDVMKTGDGRFRSFISFTDVRGLDVSRVSPQDSVTDAGRLFLRANLDRNLVFLPGNRPAALVTLGGAVYEEAKDAFGDLGLLAWATLAEQPDKAAGVFDRGFGHVGMKMWPEAVYPDTYAVPLKSNVLAYGPWYVAGAAGKVKVEVDPTLTPWAHGGFAQMVAAATARVVNAVTDMQVSEAGLLEVAGPPLCSLGDALLAGGPNVTNIDVSYGRDGVSTTYRFQTFTPRFGVFSKGLADRIKRLGLTGMELRKSLRGSLQEVAAARDTIDTAVRGFLANAPKHVKMESPHEVLACHAFDDGTTWRTCPKTLTFEETVALGRADDPEGFRRTAVMSLDGLLRPFTTSPSGAPGMSGFTAPSVPSPLTSAALNPVASGNDVSYLAWGQEYERLHAYEVGNDPADTRALALRGPLLVAGWGLDTLGRPVPGDGSGNFLPGVLRRSDRWKAGPADLLWDDRRGVWTCHDLAFGTAAADVAAGGGGTLRVWGVSGVYDLPVENWSDQTLPSGARAAAGFDPLLCGWRLFPQPAASGASGASGGLARLTVQEADGSNSYVLDDPQGSTLQFDRAAGLWVSQPSGDAARVSLLPASATQRGAVTPDAQTWAGSKTFNDGLTSAGDAHFSAGLRAHNAAFNGGAPRGGEVLLGQYTGLGFIVPEAFGFFRAEPVGFSETRLTFAFGDPTNGIAGDGPTFRLRQRSSGNDWFEVLNTSSSGDIAYAVGGREGLTTTVSYMKSDGMTTGTLTFTGGILTGSL